MKSPNLHTLSQQNSQALHLKHRAAFIHPHKQTHTDTQVHAHMHTHTHRHTLKWALLSPWCSFKWPSSLSILTSHPLSSASGPFQWRLKHRTPMYETPNQSQSPPDKLAMLADLTDTANTAVCLVSPHTATTISLL